MALVAMNDEIDIRHILPAIRVPTLLLHSVRDATIPIGASRFMAERIPGARLVELPGEDHLPWLTDSDAVLGEIEEFLTGDRHAVEPDRVLATVLFTDIVGATKKAAALGDRRWRDLRWRQRSGLPRTRSIPWSRDQDGRRWVFRGLRRSRSAVRRACAVSQGTAYWTRGPRRPRTGASRSWATIWVGPRSISALASWRWRPLGGAGVKHGQGLGRRLRLDLSRSRAAPLRAPREWRLSSRRMTT